MRIVIVMLHSEQGDTCNASHAVFEMSDEMKAVINAREKLLEGLKYSVQGLAALIFNVPGVYFIGQKFAGHFGGIADSALIDISDKMFAKIKREDKRLEIGLSSCEMRIDPEHPLLGYGHVRLYMYEKHTGTEMYTSDFPSPAFTPISGLG